jgi:hypothetical protein
MSILNETLKKIDLQTFADEGALDVNLLQRRTKVMKTAVFNQIMLEHPEYNNKQICDVMNISPSTMCRIRRDLGAKSPYRYDIPTPKRNKKVLDSEEPKKSIDSNISSQKPKQSKILPTPKKVGRPKKNVNITQNIPADNDIAGVENDEIDELLENSVSKFS